MRSFPPLNALKAFEATARLMSASQAAKELHVTPGAISHHINALEEFLGVELFKREHRKLVLTTRGEQYFQIVSNSFEAIHSATKMLKHPRSKGSLRVRAHTTFSLRWLIPRLSDFYAKHRGIELILSASNDPVDFSRDYVDFAIRFCDGKLPGTKTYKLVPNLLTPVCSPSLLAQGTSFATMAELTNHRLIQSTWPERRTDWHDWLAVEGIRRTDHLNFLYFESSALSYQAAVEGQGIAMAQLVLVADDIAKGRLVRPFERVLDRNEYTYYLVYPEKRKLSAQMQVFRDWLLSQLDSDAEPAAAGLPGSGAARSGTR